MIHIMTVEKNSLIFSGVVNFDLFFIKLNYSKLLYTLYTLSEHVKGLLNEHEKRSIRAYLPYLLSTL